MLAHLKMRITHSLKIHHKNIGAGPPSASPMLASPGPTVGNTRLLVSERSWFLLSDLLGPTIYLGLPDSIFET